MIVPARNSSSIGWSSGSLSIIATGVIAGIVVADSSVGDQLVEELGDPLPEDLHLLLLQRHRGDLVAGACLQEERALAGLTDGPGHEALGWVEPVDDRHGIEPRALPEAVASEGPAPPPTAASLDRRARCACGLAARWPSDPEREFIVSTKARCGV